MANFALSERLINHTDSAIADGLNPIDADHAINLVAANDDLFDLDKQPFKKLTANTLFDIPEYQRLYSWQEEQHREFWREINDLLNSHLEEDRDSDIEDVFFGTMYLARDEDDEPWEVIDGQQRLTTAFILLRCILRQLEAYDEDSIEEVELTEEVRTLRNIIYEETETGAERDPSIKLNKHDREFFTHLMRDEVDCIEALWEKPDIDGRKSEAYKLSTFVEKLDISETALIEAGIRGEDSDDDPLESEHRSVFESNRRLIEAFVFYQDRLSEVLERVEKAFDEEEAEETDREDALAKREIITLLNIKNYLLHCFHVGRFEITASESDLRLRIFEILNSRGLELTDTDQIRAAVINFSKSRHAPSDLPDKWYDIETIFNADSDEIERFLKTYIAATSAGVNSINDADEYLLQAFSPREDESRERVKSYLADVEDPDAKLQEIKEYAQWYHELTRTDELEGQSELSLSATDSQLTDIYLRLQRLNALAKQWHPSMLVVYAIACKEEGYVDYLMQLLREVEVITLRRLIVGASPSDVEEMHARGAGEFWSHWADSGDDVESEEIEETETPNAFEQLHDWFLIEFRRRVPTAFGETFIQTLIQQEQWSIAHMKGIWAKRSAEGLSLTGMRPEAYNPSVATLEHIFPTTPRREDTDDTNVWLTTFFEIDETSLCDPDEDISESDLEDYDDIQREVIKLIRRYEDAEIDSDEDGEIERIEEEIESWYIEEICNTVLLGSRDNKSIKNSRFAKKFYYYHRSESGFTDLDANWYFTTEGPSIQDDWINTIGDAAEDIEDDDYPDVTDIFDATRRAALDGFWTYREQTRRRFHEMPKIIETLAFESLPEDFDADITSIPTPEVYEMVLEEAQDRDANFTRADFPEVFRIGEEEESAATD